MRWTNHEDPWPFAAVGDSELSTNKKETDDVCYMMICQLVPTIIHHVFWGSQCCLGSNKDCSDSFLVWCPVARPLSIPNYHHLPILAQTLDTAWCNVNNSTGSILVKYDKILQNHVQHNNDIKNASHHSPLFSPSFTAAFPFNRSTK